MSNLSCISCFDISFSYMAVNFGFQMFQLTGKRTAIAIPSFASVQIGNCAPWEAIRVLLPCRLT